MSASSRHRRGGGGRKGGGRKFSVDVSVEVEWEYAEYSCNVTEISVKIEDFGIYGNEGHIYVIQQIDSYVSSFSKEAEVNVYE